MNCTCTGHVTSHNSCEVATSPLFLKALAGLHLTSHWLHGSFVKIREISVSYTLGKSILSSKIPVEEIKFIVSGRNLYTFTNYSGFDPEVALSGSPIYKLDEFSFPNFRTYAATIQITF